MQTAASATFPLVAALVERARHRLGSKMLAYDEVGRSIGETGGWVRKFLGRQPVRLDADTYRQIQARYARECDRLDAEAEYYKSLFLSLGEGTDAMAQKAVARVGVAPCLEASISREGDPVVAPLVGEDGE